MSCELSYIRILYFTLLYRISSPTVPANLGVSWPVLGDVEAVQRPAAAAAVAADEARLLVVDVGDRDDDQRRPGPRRAPAVHRQHREPEAVVALAVDRVLRADDAALVDVERDGHAARDAVFHPAVAARIPVRRFHLITHQRRTFPQTPSLCKK